MVRSVTERAGLMGDPRQVRVSQERGSPRVHSSVAPGRSPPRCVGRSVASARGGNGTARHIGAAGGFNIGPGRTGRSLQSRGIRMIGPTTATHISSRLQLWGCSVLIKPTEFNSFSRVLSGAIGPCGTIALGVQEVAVATIVVATIATVSVPAAASLCTSVCKSLCSPGSPWPSQAIQLPL